MSGVIGLLFVLSLGFLIWAIISPKSLPKRAKNSMTRRQSIQVFSALALLFLIVGAIITPTPKTVPKTNLNISTTAQKKTNVITTKDTTETQAIAYTTTNQNDNNLNKGQTEVAQAGKDGVETLTYKVTYTNGKQTNKALVSESVTTQPVNQIINVGTYVAPSPATSSSESSAQSTTTTAPAQSSCYPTASSGNCYEPGEYCSNADHGMTGVAGDGKTITCEDNNGWRWEP